MTTKQSSTLPKRKQLWNSWPPSEKTRKKYCRSWKISACTFQETQVKTSPPTIQKIRLSEGRELWSVQLPGGGNVNLFRTPDGDMVLDTGYGCCYDDVEKMLHSLGIDGFAHVKKVICTHADADHCAEPPDSLCR